MNLWRSARWKSQLRRPLDHYLSGFIKRYANYVNHFTHSQWWFFKIEDGYKTIAWSQNSTKLNYAFIMDAINISKRRVHTNSQVFFYTHCFMNHMCRKHRKSKGWFGMERKTRESLGGVVGGIAFEHSVSQSFGPSCSGKSVSMATPML